MTEGVGSRKELEGQDRLRALEEFNGESAGWNECSCNRFSGSVFVTFTMKEIEAKKARFVNPVVFAIEYHKRGSRFFLVTSYEHFPHYFLRIRNAQMEGREPFTELKTWHEILLRDTKVRLYFDMEYYKNVPQRPELLQDDSADRVASELWQHLLSFGKSMEEDVSKWILFQFDATIETKFSRHWIVEGAEFSDVVSVGKVVHSFVSQLPPQFTVIEKDGKSLGPIIDLSVYSKGQNLRMMGSPKFGRDNILMPLLKSGDHDWNAGHFGCSSCVSMLVQSIATARTPDVRSSPVKKAFSVISESENLVDLVDYREACGLFGTLAHVRDDIWNDHWTWIALNQNVTAQQSIVRGVQQILVSARETENNAILSSSATHYHIGSVSEVFVSCHTEGGELWESHQSAPCSDQSEQKPQYSKSQQQVLLKIQGLARDVEENPSLDPAPRYSASLQRLAVPLRSKFSDSFDLSSLKKTLDDLGLNPEAKARQRFQKAKQKIGHQVLLLLNSFRLECSAWQDQISQESLLAKHCLHVLTVIDTAFEKMSRERKMENLVEAYMSVPDEEEWRPHLKETKGPETVCQACNSFLTYYFNHL